MYNNIVYYYLSPCKSILTRFERMIELFVKFENKTTLTTFRTKKKKRSFLLASMLTMQCKATTAVFL